MPLNENEEPETYLIMVKSELLFFWVFLIIIFSWVLIDLYGRWLNNFTFITLGLDEKSSWHTFIIAITVTAIIFSCIIFLKKCGYNMEPAVCIENNGETVPIPSPMVIYDHV